MARGQGIKENTTMADFSNYTYAQTNFGVAGADNSGSDISGPPVVWPDQSLSGVAMPETDGQSRTLMAIYAGIDSYNVNKFNLTVDGDWNGQPTGPAIDPTGCQKGEQM